MDITVPTADLKKLLTAAKRVTPRASALPSLKGVRLVAAGDTLTLQTTDLDVTLTSSLPAEVRAEGVAVVPVAELAAHVKGKGSIALTLNGENLEVVNGTRSLLRTLPADEWPREGDANAFTRTPSYPLDLTAIAEVAVAASRDEARPILAGVLFDGAEVVATDSYRLHRLRTTETSYPRVLLPAKALLLAAKAGPTGILRVHTVTHNAGTRQELTLVDARITVGNQVFDIRGIEGEYPNYTQLIPSGYPVELVADRDSFISVVEGVKPMAKFASPVRLTVEDDQLVVSAVTRDVGQAQGSLPCKVIGDFPSVIAFNPEFLLDCLTTLGEEKVTLTLLDALKPACFTERRYTWERRRGGKSRVGTFTGMSTRLIMPVRVS